MKLDLQAPVLDYLPELAIDAPFGPITIHHLLTHTGGTGDFFGPEFDKHRLELKTLQDYHMRLEESALPPESATALKQEIRRFQSKQRGRTAGT